MLELRDLEARLSTDPTLRYWDRKLLRRVFSVGTYSELGKLALGLAEKMPKPIMQVCGPIATGGLNSVEKNLDVLNRTIRKLTLNGEVIFNQMPFEWPMQELRRKSTLSVEETGNMLLNDFYLPVFESGLISGLHFIYCWESSYGARREHGQAERLGIDISYLEKDFHLK